MMSSRIVDVTTPPTIGAAILFMTSDPVPWLNIIGTSPARMTETVMILGLILFDGAIHDGLFQGIHIYELAFALPSLMSQFKVKEHYDAGFGIEAGQCYYADPYCDAHVVAEQIQQPERSDE